MADREGRKAELERKKARLLAMRAEKNKKEVRYYITRVQNDVTNESVCKLFQGTEAERASRNITRSDKCSIRS